MTYRTVSVNRISGALGAEIFGVDLGSSNLGDEVIGEIRQALKIKTVVRAGKAYQQIIDFAAETHPDTIVMGVRGRGAVDLAVFGSTTYRVLQLGPCPVLAVHL